MPLKEEWKIGGMLLDGKMKLIKRKWMKGNIKMLSSLSLMNVNLRSMEELNSTRTPELTRFTPELV